MIKAQSPIEQIEWRRLRCHGSDAEFWSSLHSTKRFVAIDRCRWRSGMTRGSAAESGSDTVVEQILALINKQHFRNWRSEREFARNIREGNPNRNEPSQVPPSSRHNPSRLLQCHRKTYYRYHNAPGETRKPAGVFWFGSQFETELFRPFLRGLTGPDQYVRNSVWVDFTIPSPDGELRFRGRTDPLVVDTDSTPHLLTEIKTTSSLTALDVPKPHHKAQVHAYLKGLSQKHDQVVRDAVIIYIKRDDLTLKVFHSTFDAEFWESRVLDWAAKNTEYRRTGELPPANPEHDWECRFCDFRQRCGMGTVPFADTDSRGLLPLHDGYPRERLVAYLQSYPEAQLTPTLARNHPDLANEYDVYDWRCQVCGGEHAPDTVDWNGDTDHPPLCPSCSAEGTYAPLAGPQPEAQIEDQGVGK